ncbi:alpha/beta-hydrolase [Sistotremastrum niveocremeum HHB9708]|uniref:Alpha/beta-hydrolase n=1 Tax=Sistotremastrum niveocremeum HHB9708 TaxID=1314777 RepID=A0A164RC72_9AGAM|nr:alpha/beta-hydrolase [Sistotremastrum niveocremeum HHB9708]
MSTPSFFVFRAQKPLAIFGAGYVACLILLTVPWIQRHVLYLHAVRWPLFADFETPEKYGMAPGKTIPLRIPTRSADVELGAWLTLSDPFYRSSSTSSSNLTAALERHPTVLFFHGNAGTRAVSFRVNTYRYYSISWESNVLAIDYRGFADSTGSPSQQGLIEDGRASWDWLIRNGAKEEDIVIVGQSLGTAVAAHLGAELSKEGVSPKGVVLFAPFSGIHKLLETYSLFGFVPLLSPLMNIPFAFKLLMTFLADKWSILEVIRGITVPLILCHARDDLDIPVSHSVELFDAILDPQLPGVENTLKLEKDDWEILKNRKALREKLVRVSDVDQVGTLHELQRDGGDVWFLESLYGGHNGVSFHEGIMGIIGDKIMNM